MDGKINNIEQICSVKKLMYYDGKENGNHVIEVNNGLIQFTILEDRAMDLYDFSYKGKNLAFLTKNGITGFQSQFPEMFPGGMLYTCGLDTVGGRAMPIHGKLHNIPSRLTMLNQDEKTIEILGETRQCGLFEENLRVIRRFKTDVNSSKLEIETEIINDGGKDEKYCLLLHMNVGYPMLDEGTTISAPVISTKPRTEWAAKNIEKCFVFEDADPNTEEQVFFHKVKEGRVSVINSKLGLKMNFEYDSSVLPEFIEWKSLVYGSYALGIEPATTTLDDEFSMSTIKPGEHKLYKVTLSVDEI